MRLILYQSWVPDKRHPSPPAETHLVQQIRYWSCNTQLSSKIINSCKLAYQKWMNKGWKRSLGWINKRSYSHPLQAVPFSLCCQKKRRGPHGACNGLRWCPETNEDLCRTQFCIKLALSPAPYFLKHLTIIWGFSPTIYLYGLIQIALS